METKLFEEGAFVQVNSPVIKGWHKVSSLKELLANQDESAEEEYTLKWQGKPLPKEIMGEVLALAAQFPHTEVQVCLYYNTKEEKWLAHPPRQEGSAAHVSYNDEDWQEPQGYYMAGTIHTHPNIAAFWSRTDTNDQVKHNGFHVVLSLREGKLADYLVSLSYNGVLYPQDKSLVEIPEELPEVNKEWLERVKILPPKEDYKGKYEKAFAEHISNGWDYSDRYSWQPSPWEETFWYDEDGTPYIPSNAGDGDTKSLMEQLYALPEDIRYTIAHDLLESLGHNALADRLLEEEWDAAESDSLNV